MSECPLVRQRWKGLCFSFLRAEAFNSAFADIGPNYESIERIPPASEPIFVSTGGELRGLGGQIAISSALDHDPNRRNRVVLWKRPPSLYSSIENLRFLRSSAIRRRSEIKSSSVALRLCG